MRENVTHLAQNPLVSVEPPTAVCRQTIGLTVTACPSPATGQHAFLRRAVFGCRSRQRLLNPAPKEGGNVVLLTLEQHVSDPSSREKAKRPKLCKPERN